jgi:predicted metal-dependent HD superfamily phosphohydrolase
MTAVNFERWSRACIELGVPPEQRGYRRVRRGWNSLGRHYHTLAHLDACLRELDACRDLARRAAEVELALWFHDAVYRSWRRDNEVRSAALAAHVLRAAPADAMARIREMILGTKHLDAELVDDAALVADLDLSILGQPPQTYVQFARAVRREYWWVPRARYTAGRRAVLEGFLARSSIYQHDRFRRRYEHTARANIAAELVSLRQP